MATPNFPDIPPDRTSKRKKKNRVLVADFGDGYSQALPDGLNTAVEEWDLSFKNYPAAEVMQLVDFFDDLGGYRHFTWTAPGDTEEKKWRQDGEYSVGFPGHETGDFKVKVKRVYVA